MPQTIAIPETMKAVVLTGHGGPEKLKYHTDWPTPKSVGPDQLLLRVGACGLNNTDVNTRVGWYSKSVTGATPTSGEATTSSSSSEAAASEPSWGGAPIQFPRIQGADVCGEVVSVGENADPSWLGKRVIADCWQRDWDDDPLNRDKSGYYGSECNGGFAEYALVDRRNAGVVNNADLSDAELATFSCSYTTAEGMLSRAGVVENDTVLITGASGGVGSALIQLAKRRGARVVAMASYAKHAELQALLDEPEDALLPREVSDMASALKAAIGQSHVSVVADVVGGPAFSSLIEVLERGGRYTCSGAIAGPIVDLDLRTLYLNDLTFTGSTVVPPQIFQNVLSYIEAGEIKPLLASTYPLSKFHEAQSAFVQKLHIGNIAVIP